MHTDVYFEASEDLMQRFKLISLNLVCILLLAYFMVLAWQRVVSSTPYFANDYKTFYTSLYANKNIYSAHYYSRVLSIIHKKDKITMRITPKISSINMNTPIMNVFLKGLVNVSNRLPVSTFAWMMLSLVGATISLGLMVRYYDPLGINRYNFIPFLFMLWLSWPSLYNLKLGEVAYFVLPLVCGGFLLMHLKRWRTMTIILALLASVKLFFLIFILLFILKRQWRLMGLFIFSFLIFFFLPLLYFPWSDYVAFYHLSQNYPVFIDRCMLPMNASLLGVIAHIIVMTHHKINLIFVRMMTASICLLVMMLFVMYDHLRLRHLPVFSDELRFSFLIIFSLLCSPLGWDYYFLFLLVPVVLIFKIARQYALSKMVYVFLPLALFLPYFAWAIGTSTVVSYLQNFSVFAALISWLLCLLCASGAVARAHNQLPKQQENLVGIFVIFSLINVLLLQFNYGISYFFDLNQRAYLEQVAPVVQMHSDPIL